MTIYWQTIYVYVRSIRWGSNVSIVIKTGTVSFNELLDSSGSSLQATYGYLRDAIFFRGSHVRMHESTNNERNDRAMSPLLLVQQYSGLYHPFKISILHL